MLYIYNLQLPGTRSSPLETGTEPVPGWQVDGLQGRPLHLLHTGGGSRGSSSNLDEESHGYRLGEGPVLGMERAQTPTSLTVHVHGSKFVQGCSGVLVAAIGENQERALKVLPASDQTHTKRRVRYEPAPPRLRPGLPLTVSAPVACLSSLS
jgi:hypothetical protein